MKKRRLVVHIEDRRNCKLDGGYISLEFILLVPKDKYFDGVIDFPIDVDLGKYSRITCKSSSAEKPLPYKRPQIYPYGNIKDIDLSAIDDPFVTYQKEEEEKYDCSPDEDYEELILGDAGGFYSTRITMCDECLKSYDYYTVFECKYETVFKPRYSYIADSLAPELKRLLQYDYSEDVYIKDLERHAVDGDAPAMSYLALAYYYGDGVEQNYDEAAKWCKKAAEKCLEISKNK